MAPGRELAQVQGVGLAGQAGVTGEEPGTLLGNLPLQATALVLLALAILSIVIFLQSERRESQADLVLARSSYAPPRPARQQAARRFGMAANNRASLVFTASQAR
jgi:hypothetical protein